MYICIYIYIHICVYICIYTCIVTSILYDGPATDHASARRAHRRRQGAAQEDRLYAHTVHVNNNNDNNNSNNNKTVKD